MEELVKEIAGLKALVNRLLLRIEELEAENADLRGQLGQNLSNSHKPPSIEGYSKKPLIKCLRTTEPPVRLIVIRSKSGHYYIINTLKLLLDYLKQPCQNQ